MVHFSIAWGWQNALKEVTNLLLFIIWFLSSFSSFFLVLIIMISFTLKKNMLILRWLMRTISCMMYLVSHDQCSIFCIQYLGSPVLCWFDPKKKSVPVANCVHGVWRGELHLWCISLWNQVISWTFYKSDQKLKTKLNRVPERLFPGRCDLWGQSHQIFHILVVAGALAHLKVILLQSLN